MADIVKLIEELVTEKTFSLDAVSAINKIREQAIAVSRELETTKKSLERVMAENQVYEREVEKFREKERNLVEREKKMTELERDVAVKTAVAQAYTDQFNRMFANRVVRESNISQQYVASGQPNSGPILMPNNSNVTKEEG